ncbi:MAG: redox-regulated ATPase YchF [Candidatus Methylarchaceae archaeon HK01B]|nr:redox-regulated ATPase YchF [Candidatus Methylarchaceae archaeon HK01B]
MPIKIGLIGKTNTGKTTFFNSATLRSAEVSTYPFTTKAPNLGTGNAVTLCVHREFQVDDNPKNSLCIEGWRFIPIELIDLPGLIKGAWAGKGLGNQFLSVAAQSDALLHIVDASGGIDAGGRITEPGIGDPLADIGDIEEELVMWYLKLIEGNRSRISKLAKSGIELPSAMVEVLRGIGIKESHVKTALSETKLEVRDFDNWSEEATKDFAWMLRDISKPTLILANKMDLPTSAENFKRIQDEYSDMIVVPASAEAELTLRRAEQKGFIKYVPGEERFEILNHSALTDRQKWALRYIRKAVLGEYMRTGVQFAMNVAVFKLLRMNSVYPVYDSKKLSDKKGNVLPDVYLLPSGSAVFDLAKEVHSDLARGLLYAIDARSGLRLPSDYIIKDRDVLSIVSTSRKKGPKG